MKNPEKLAASKKKPRVPVYTISGKIAWVRCVGTPLCSSAEGQCVDGE